MSDPTTGPNNILSADARLNNLPKISYGLRLLNILLLIVLAIPLLWFLQWSVFSGLTISWTSMTNIYLSVGFIGFVNTCCAIYGNGFKSFCFLTITSIISLIVGLVLMNQQIYLWIVGIKVLGFGVCLGLMNGWHYLTFIAIIFAFALPLLWLEMANKLLKREKWFEIHKGFWST